MGRAVLAWLSPVEGISTGSSVCRRIPVAPGVEVLIDEQHPALRLNGDTSVIAEAMRQALGTVVGLEPAVAVTVEIERVEAWRPPHDAAEVLDDSIQGA